MVIVSIERCLCISFLMTLMLRSLKEVKVHNVFNLYVCLFLHKV